MQHRILVTGATGFVGSHALTALSTADGAVPIAACRAPGGLPKGFSGEVRAGDLHDPAYLDSVTRDVDVICHAAAWTSAWGHARQSDARFLAPSTALIDSAVRNGVKRFIFLSSTSVTAPNRTGQAKLRAVPEKLGLWPHLRNVARIEAHMEAAARRSPTEMVSLRVGLFAGQRYSIGMLPMLVPRLKTHLVPWIDGGRAEIPLTADRDIGAAFRLAALHPEGTLPGFTAFDIVGPEIPTMREVVTFLAETYGLPKPHFSVPFALAYPFGRLMEWTARLTGRDPLVTRSIIHLLEPTGASNARAAELLGYVPQIGWKEAVAAQMEEMAVRQTAPMKMVKPA